MVYIKMKIEFTVDRGVFCRLIAAYCWLNRVEFEQIATVGELRRVVKSTGKWYGQGGVDTAGWSGADEDFVKGYKDSYDAAGEYWDEHYFGKDGRQKL